MSDDDWLRNKLQEEPGFMLEFSDKQQILVLQRLRNWKLFAELCQLCPFLLFGHPNMKEKVAEHRSDNGIMVLTLLSVKMQIQQFLLP